MKIFILLLQIIKTTEGELLLFLELVALHIIRQVLPHLLGGQVGPFSESQKCSKVKAF